MQRQRHVADRVGEIDTNCDAALLRRCRDFFDIEQLAGEKIYASDEHDRKLIGVLLDKIDNILCSNRELAIALTSEDERILLIEPVMNDLRFDRIGVGREGR